MPSPATTIGIIGLGNMGGAIAERLIGAGVALHLNDVHPPTLETFAGLGAVTHPTPRHLADTADVVLTCLPNVEACRLVRAGGDGIGAGSRVRHVVELSTVGPENLRAHAALLAGHGIETLDAPVSGGAPAVRAGTLTIMVGGPAETLARLRPVLARISEAISHVGPRIGDGQTMKLVNNLLAAANMATSYEALALGVKLGLSPAAMLEVIGRSSGANTGFTARKIGAVSSRRFDAGAKLRLLEKDIDLAFDEAEKAGFPIAEMTALTGMAQLWRDAGRQGLSDADISTLAQVIEKRANIVIRE